MAHIYRAEPEKVAKNAAALRSAILETRPALSEGEITPAMLDLYAARLCARMDRVHGGLKGAPKFPVLSQTWNLREQKRLAELRIAHAARMSNCSAREGRGLKAYLACRLRIMAIISMPPRMVRALSADLNPSMGRTRLLMER